MSRLARVMVRLSTSHPRLTIVLCLALAAGAVVCARRGLTFETSSLRLLPPQRVYVQQFERFLQEFGELNDIVIVVESEHPDAAKDFAARLAATLMEPPLRAERVTFRVDPDRFAGRALLYLSMERLEELRDSVMRHRQFLEDYAAQPTLARLIGAVDHEIVRTFAGRFIDLGLEETSTVDASFVERLLAAIDDRLAAPGSRPSPWTAVFTGAQDERSGYFTSSDGRLLFVLVEPRREAGNFTDNKDVIASIRRAIERLRAEFPDVAAGVTGTPALSNDEMLTAFRDSTVATAVACVVVLVVVLLAFRQVTKPLVMLFALLVSLAWSLGLIALTVGHLTVFSVMFISLFIGLGVDYGIYLLFRYEEERGDGHDPATALRITADRAGPGILFAALSAAGSFGVLMLTEFRGIVEFGFIGALSILLALVAMLTLFPALLLVLDRRHVAHIRLVTRAWNGHPSVGILERIAQYQRLLLGVAVALSAFSLWAVAGVGFDYNRLNLQAKGTESVTWETKIMAAGRSAFPALSAARSLDDLRARQEAFLRLSTVSDVVSVLSAIPKEQAPKTALLRELAPTVGAVRVGAGSSAEPQALRAALAGLRRRLALAIREAGDTGPSATLVAADRRAADIAERLASPEAETHRRLDAIQEEFRRDFDAKLRRFQANLAPTPVTVNDLPDEIRRKFVGRSGAFLLQVSPAVNIWTREGMQEFVDDLRTVDAAVTGSPVISYEASRMMERAYFEGTFYAVLLVLALAGVMLRRVSDTLLAVVPMVLGTLWMVGFMKVAGLSFNLANVWALPLVIGAAAEYGLNVALRHREALEHGGPSLARSTVMAVTLNGMTTIAGFGSLLLAHHQGMFGLGLLLTAGTVAGLAASLLILPALLYRFGYVPERPAKDMRRLAETVVSRRHLSIVLVALALLAPARPPAATAADEPAERVRTTVDELYRLASPPPRTASERRERDGAAARVADRLFDWSAMARQTLGKHWEARTAAEREEFTRLFADLFRHAYVSRISLVEASGFKYGASTIAGGRATVNTQVTTRRGSVIGVTYALARDGGQDWRVHDVLVEGISLLDNYRTQFASIIARSSYEALVDRLRSRVREHG